MRIGNLKILLAAAMALPCSIEARVILRHITKLPEGIPPFTARPTQDLSYIKLGEGLFYDKWLSGDGKHSCSSCHEAKKAFSGTSFRHENCSPPERDVPPLINLYARSSAMWDGRVKVENQPIFPIENRCELSISWEKSLINLRRRYYVRYFSSHNSRKYISKDDVVKALATFVQSIVTRESKFDKYYYGEKDDAISKKAKMGLKLFLGKARCSSCHTIGGSFATLADDGFHAVNFVNAGSDLGRFNFSNNGDDKYKFRTPTLRNISDSYPYFHNGSVKNLGEVLDLYSTGIPYHGMPVDRKIMPSNMSTLEKKQVIEFLKTLKSKIAVYVGK